MKPLAPRQITDADPVSTFKSGVESLDLWLAERALKNEQQGVSRTYISVDADSGAIVGYYCLASWAVARQEAGGSLARNAPNPVPVILLGRLAVRRDAQHIGIAVIC